MDWISTKDKLPERKTPVLIIHNSKIRIGTLFHETPGWEETFKAYDYWDDPDDGGQDWEWDDVTHWMNLPPLPWETL